MTAPNTDPRGGHTSASNALADKLCPGRHLAQKGLPEEASVYAESGRKVHAALAALQLGDHHGNRPLVDRLDGPERETYSACVDIQRKLVSQFFGDRIDGYREFHEERYWSRFKANGVEYQHSGQADFVGRVGMRALIIDYKTMPGEVAESPRNLQLRDLACLVRGTYVPTSEIAVAIVQPSVTSKPELCLYNKEELDRATREMFTRVMESNRPDNKRVAGEAQCKYCRAKSHCTVYQQWAGQITPPAMLSLLGVPMVSWTPDQCAIAAEALAPAQKFLDDLKDMLKDRLSKQPGSVPGWELRPGAVRESIVNPQEVFNRFVKLGGTVENFMPCVDIGKTKLKDALSKVTGAKGKALLSAMDTIVAGATEQKQGAPVLKRSDPAPKALP